MIKNEGLAAVLMLVAQLGGWLTVITLMLKGIRAVNKLNFLLENFPPHRHVGDFGGEIIYPDKYGPAPSEKSQGKKVVSVA